MAIEIKNIERVRLTGQTVKLTFLDSEGKPYVYEVFVDKYLGEGTSSICYEVTVVKGQGDIGQKRVLKQFYPDPKVFEIDTRMTGIHLEIEGYSRDPECSQNKEINRLGDAFENAYGRQVELANESLLGDVMVRPELHYFDGATKYILYESDYGTEFDPDQIRSVDTFIRRMYELSGAIWKLHQAGILYMDLKPANILVSGGGRIKLFDFDAVADMRNLEAFHLEDGDLRYDMEHPEAIAPEIRPDRLREFEQNKKLLLTQKVDIYSIGAMMLYFFLQRFPTEEDTVSMESFVPQMRELFTYQYRGELTEDEQALLNEIIWNSIQKNIGPGGRYADTGKLVEQLGKLLTMISGDASRRRKVYRKVDGRLQAAYVMDKYPLCDFRRDSGVMDSLIVGDDPVADSFFTNIIACSQMLDTRHVVRVAFSHAGERLQEYIKKWPMLNKTTRLFLNDVPWKKMQEQDRVITETPFAEIRFYDWDPMSDLWDFVSGMEHSEEISWMVFCDADLEKNIHYGETMAEHLAENGQKYFIAYLDERGDGYDLRRSSRRDSNIILEPFGCNSRRSLSGKNFNTGINRRAKLLHKFYAREWMERAGESEIWADFSSDSYNVTSSLCSVLSIPYKLRSIGIRTEGGEAAQEYESQVLDRSSPLAQRKFNNLIYLEHRRWMCFMMTEGYDRPAKNVLTRYAFKGGNNQRNKVDKFHMCLCGCGKDNGIVLDRFNRSDWEKPNMAEIAQQKGLYLDELDTASVWFHQMCGRKVSDMKENGEFTAVFAALEKEMRQEKYSAADFELLHSLKNIHERMLVQESNIINLWDKARAAFKARIRSGEGVARVFDELDQLTRVVVEYNQYHDYKSSDRTILEVIPLLILSDDPIRCVHKPVAEQTWQNLASSMIIEPEKLILYARDEDAVDLECIRKFLIRERGLELDEDDICLKSWEDLEQLKLYASSIKGVLDVTGLEAEDMYDISRMDNLKSLPVILFRDGSIRSFGGKTEADYYGVLRRHLSVEEMFRVHNARMISSDRQNYMLRLTDNYELIWKAYIKMNSFQYRILVETLRNIELKNYWLLPTVDPRRQTQNFEKNYVPYGMLQAAGIHKLLQELKKGGWIRELQLPEAGKVGKVAVKGTSPQVWMYLQRMFDSVQKHAYMHQFVLTESERDPKNNWLLSQKRFYIYDDTLLVDEYIQDEVLPTSRGERKRSVLDGAFRQIEEVGKNNGRPFILDRYEESAPILSGEKDSDLHLCFVYYSRATKECLMKEGNILEAYIYHSLWKYAFADDIKLNVEFAWEDEQPKFSSIRNEIDLVCARNMQTFFISCKQAMPKTEHLQEIKYFADYFGVDGKAILVTSNAGTSGKGDTFAADMITKRSRKMQVYYVDRQMIGDQWTQIARGNIVKYLQNIFDGKKNWEEI